MIINLLLAISVYSVVPDLDFQRYAGTWHEIARFPNRFQEKCVGNVTANYTLRPDGRIEVLNRCRRQDGSYISARGLARHVDRQPRSVLKVRFAPAFLSFLPQVWGDYQVVALAPDYSYAAVGSPNLKYLWILSRTPELPTATYNEVLAQLRAKGFDIDRLVRNKDIPSGDL